VAKTTPVEQLSKETQELYEVLNDESDLACVVIGTAFLDTALATILERKLIKSSVSDKLLSHRGALGSFAPRADLVYCLGLINKKHYRDLCGIDEIRTQFAHSHLRLSFANPKVREMCDNLKEWRLLLPHDDDGEVVPGATEAQLAVRARNQFKLSVASLSNCLLLKALGLNKDSSA